MSSPDPLCLIRNRTSCNRMLTPPLRFLLAVAVGTASCIACDPGTYSSGSGKLSASTWTSLCFCPAPLVGWLVEMTGLNLKRCAWCGLSSCFSEQLFAKRPLFAKVSKRDSEAQAMRVRCRKRTAVSCGLWGPCRGKYVRGLHSGDVLIPNRCRFTAPQPV
jgi:hypothetical protein